jgi:hypothetical protein
VRWLRLQRLKLVLLGCASQRGPRELQLRETLQVDSPDRVGLRCGVGCLLKGAYRRIQVRYLLSLAEFRYDPAAAPTGASP